MLWRDYLTMLRKDGVTLDESEDEAITANGERIIAHMLVREVEGRWLYYVLPDEVREDDRVPRSVLRQAPVVLRLPPERYIFPKLD